MKIRGLLGLFCIVSVTSYAQNTAVLLRDTTQLGLSVTQLKKTYRPEFSKLTVKAGATTQVEGAFGDKATQENAKVYRDSMMRWSRQFYSFFEEHKKRLTVPGMLVDVQEFIRPDGSFERVFCEFMPKDLPEKAQQQALQLLNEWYTAHPFPLKTKAGFYRHQMQVLGRLPEKRTVRHGPGLINSLADAQKTTRPDTVKTLAFNQLELTSIPDVVYRFPKLEELDLSKNGIHELPARLIEDLPNLQRLSLLYNRIPDDSVFLPRNHHLTSLNLQGNRLTRIPATIRKNRMLASLWLGNNKLTNLDLKSLRGLRQLTDLNLYNAGLTELPKTLKKLRHLTVLDLYYNKLKTLPKQLGRLKRLEQLAVSHNELKQLTPALGKLKKLQMLYAHHNQLSQLPETLPRIPTLHLLDLGNNWFTNVPTVLDKLPALAELDLSNNNIQEFPAVLLSLKHLQKLNMGSNPLFGREAMQSPYAPQIRQLEANRVTVLY